MIRIYSYRNYRFFGMLFLWLLMAGCAFAALKLVWPVLLLLVAPAAVWFSHRDQRDHDAHGPQAQDECRVCRRAVRKQERADAAVVNRLAARDRLEREVAARNAERARLLAKYNR